MIKWRYIPLRTPNLNSSSRHHRTPGQFAYGRSKSQQEDKCKVESSTVNAGDEACRCGEIVK